MAAAVGHCGRCSAAGALVTLHLVRMGVNRVAISFSKCLGVQTWASSDTVQRAWRPALSLRVRCPLLATPIAGRQSETRIRARIAMRVHIAACMLKPWPGVSNCRSTRHHRLGASRPTCATATCVRALRCLRDAKDRVHAGIAQDPVLCGRGPDLTSTCSRADFTFQAGARRGQRHGQRFPTHGGRSFVARFDHRNTAIIEFW